MNTYSSYYNGLTPSYEENRPGSLVSRSPYLLYGSLIGLGGLGAAYLSLNKSNSSNNQNPIPTPPPSSSTSTSSLLLNPEPNIKIIDEPPIVIPKGSQLETEVLTSQVKKKRPSILNVLKTTGSRGRERVAGYAGEVSSRLFKPMGDVRDYIGNTFDRIKTNLAQSYEVLDQINLSQVRTRGRRAVINHINTSKASSVLFGSFKKTIDKSFNKIGSNIAIAGTALSLISGTLDPSKISMGKNIYTPDVITQYTESIFDKMSQTIDPIEENFKKLLIGITAQESGGHPAPYRALGPKTKYGHALGKYQIMPFHLDKVGLKNTLKGRQAFLKSPELQERLFTKIMKENAIRVGGDLHKTIAAYYGGLGGAKKLGTAYSKKQFIKGNPSIEQYVKEVIEKSGLKKTAKILK